MKESSSDSYISIEETKPKFMENIMIQNLDKKRNVNLSLEITKRKKIFNRYIRNNFGQNFIKIKPESYLDLVDKCKTFYFSPESQFLSNFPKLKAKILKERNINNNKLLTKIDLGNLLYLSEARKKRYLDQNDQKNERLITYSKNFSSQNTKDLISNEIYKATFWDKNAKKNDKILKNKFAHIIAKFFDKTDDKEINEKDKEKLVLFNNNLENSEINKENKRYNPIMTYYNNIAHLKNEYNSEDFDENLEANENIKESYTNMNSLKDSSFPSIINNTHSLKTFSNEREKINNLKTINPISRNMKILDLKKKTKTSFSSTIKPSLINNNSASSSSFKYKKNLNNKVMDLNFQTHLCNKQLYNLIDNNKTILPGKRLKNSEKDFDVNFALSESSNYPSKWKKNNQGTFSYLTYEKLNSTIEKNLQGEKTNVIVKEAKNNFESENNFRKRELKLFPKKIIEMRDEYALEMVDKLFSRDQLSRNKMPGLKETVKERREMRDHRFVNILRNRAKINHDKIIRMGFYLAKEKEKFYLKNKKKVGKLNKKANNDENKNNNKFN